MDGSMTWWEGRWVARMRITPAARPRAIRSRARAAKSSRSADRKQPPTAGQQPAPLGSLVARAAGDLRKLRWVV